MEFERRFLVAPGVGWKSAARPYAKLLEDRYLSCGRLRLRTQTDLDTGRRVLKLTKKFFSPAADHQPLITMVLSEEEHTALRSRAGFELAKIRHYAEPSARTFSIDVFKGTLEGLVLSEIEAPSREALQAIPAPPFALREVTEEPFFEGGNLCRASREDLLTKLREAWVDP